MKTATACLALAALATTGSCSEPPWAPYNAARPPAERPPAAAVRQVAGPAGLPADAKPGECFARTAIPAIYRTIKRTVVVQPATERIETLPPEYGWEERRIEVTPPQTTQLVVRATDRWIEERVLVEPEVTQTRIVPARFETRAERVMVSPTRQVWKPGRGPIERVDGRTGQILCLVEEPAQYRTVMRQVEVSPARVETYVVREAQYRRVRRSEVDRPTSAIEEVAPARYETVRVRIVTKPASERRIAVPAVTRVVAERVVERPARTAWRAILCATNVTPAVVLRVQQALVARGFDPGAANGRLHSRTMAALVRYQTAHGLARGQLTYETLHHLGVETARSG